jgi:hypothetical protein
MSRSNRPKLALRKETLRKLAAGDLGRVAGGLIARCTYERSGCYGGQDTRFCATVVCETDCCDSNMCR